MQVIINRKIMKVTKATAALPDGTETRGESLEVEDKTRHRPRPEPVPRPRPKEMLDLALTIQPCWAYDTRRGSWPFVCEFMKISVLESEETKGELSTAPLHQLRRGAARR